MYVNESDHLVAANLERHKEPALGSGYPSPQRLGLPTAPDEKGTNGKQSHQEGIESIRQHKR